MSDIDDVLDDLKQKRDEVRVRLHLASRELRDEWEELEDKMEHFTAKAHLKQTGRDVGRSLGDLGHELKLGYERLRDALKD